MKKRVRRGVICSEKTLATLEITKSILEVTIGKIYLNSFTACAIKKSGPDKYFDEQPMRVEGEFEIRSGDWSGTRKFDMNLVLLMSDISDFEFILTPNNLFVHSFETYEKQGLLPATYRVHYNYTSKLFSIYRFGNQEIHMVGTSANNRWIEPREGILDVLSYDI